VAEEGYTIPDDIETDPDDQPGDNCHNGIEEQDPPDHFVPFLEESDRQKICAQ
jgi:hypothetical protein